ncbi:ATP-binding protein [Planomonospora sp. ID67723]|uniref:ATP-binding protein n=1 Tax=Planomonospora sp. ID67723 TaxID=2738134 RepID=UPI0018C4068C|nr:ATP-binding protein [Planomonospora sp. ID67723]MBG0828207.1 ATP-binding protein [Planomonospora sp. ID67723]
MALTVSRPLQREFPGSARQVPAARAWVLGCLPAGCPRADDVALVLTELVTNAVLHSTSGTAGGGFTVRVEAAAAGVELTVTDQGPRLVPARREPEESGRGLELVLHLADGYEVTDVPAGRTVWCRLDWPPVGEGAS